MTRDEVRKLADLAEWARLEAFAGLIHGYVVHEEREACAKVCDRIASAIKLYCNEAHVVACAEAIRKRCAP